MVRRWIRQGIGALLIAVAAGAFLGTRSVHAQEDTGSCDSWSTANAYAYDDPTRTGSSDSWISADSYTHNACMGLARTHALFEAGSACENAGIPAGVSQGLGTATVRWYVTWTSDAIADHHDRRGPFQYGEQQYDCGDTASYVGS